MRVSSNCDRGTLSLPPPLDSRPPHLGRAVGEVEQGERNFSLLNIVRLAHGLNVKNPPKLSRPSVRLANHRWLVQREGLDRNGPVRGILLFLEGVPSFFRLLMAGVDSDCRFVEQ